MTVYFILMSVFSVVNLALLLLVFNRKRLSLDIVSMFCFIVVANIGYLLMAVSSTLEGVLVANKACYMAACVLPLFELSVALQMCKFSFPFWGKMVLTVLTLVVFAMSCTVGFSDVFYESMEYTQIHGVASYTVVFGPGHMLWNVLLMTYVVLSAVTVVYAAFKKKNVSYKTLIAIAFLNVISILSFFASRFVGSDTLVMPAVYVLSELVLFKVYYEMKMYDVAGNVLEALVAENECAFVAFSSRGVYLGCNDIALQYFPELKKLRIDHKIPKDNDISGVFSDLFENSVEKNHESVFHFSRNGRYYKSSLKNVKRRNITKIFLFRIEDETELQRYIEHLDMKNSKLEHLVKSNEKYVQTIQKQMIVGMASMVEGRDANTGSHIKRTSDAVAIIVEELKKDPSLKYSEEFYDALVASAPMHDLGKIAVDDRILRKLGTFTPEEYAAMKTHAEKGATIVEHLLTGIESPFFIKIARNVARYHHERWDGSGYPTGIAGEVIPFEARVMAVADVYDALVSRRSYKGREPLDFAFEKILNDMGRNFDPGLKRYVANVRSKLEEYYRNAEC